MLLLLLAALCFSAVKGSLYYEEVCYGGNYLMPMSNIPAGDLYFTPRNGGERKLVMNSTRGVDPRYRVTRSSFSVIDVRERDEGTFSINLYSLPGYNLVTLRVKDCSETFTFYYGQTLSRSVTNRAEYIEFTPIHQVDKTVVLWNRAVPHTRSRGTMRNNVWEMNQLTQSDNGHYNIRRRDNSLFKRWKITIEARSEHYDKAENEELRITCDMDLELLTVTFKPETGMNDMVLIRSGSLVSFYSEQFSKRVHPLDHPLAIVIEDLQPADSGLYECRDQNNNLAVVVSLTVLEQAPTFLYIGIAVGIILGLILCCCCVKRCCCGKSSKGGDAVPQTPDEPEVDHNPSRAALTSYSSSPHPPRYTYHPPNPINSTAPTSSSTDPPAVQPAATSKVSYYSYKPTNPINPPEPTSTSINPPAIGPADVHVSSPQPEVGPLGQGASPTVTFGSDSLSSTADHRFELKFPSAPPLSAEATFPSVYNSDKLNFF
ncbi:uncharacterized protein LOC143011921 [Genypterus blacodes]|uniref:uncharacterized protein LOC143011921 n=1 Tax=Genypterus blacodes TaxID=154954 RepID=UPI003F76B220